VDGASLVDVGTGSKESVVVEAGRPGIAVVLNVLESVG
jgi:hypothetical protein